MGFIVVRERGASDYEFQEYTRISRYYGFDLGKSPRAHDARMGKRWLPVWADREKVEEFVAELRTATKDPSWEVVTAKPVAPDGPLGPMLIKMAERAIELVFCLEPFGQAILASAFPQAVPALTFAVIRREEWDVYRARKGGLDVLVREIAPLLTGLDAEQLRSLGYSLVEHKSEKTRVAVPPAGIAEQVAHSSPVEDVPAAV